MSCSLDAKTATLEKAVRELRAELADSRAELSNSRQKVDTLTRILYAHQQKHKCEILYADGNVNDAARLLLDFMKTACEDAKADTIIMDWLSSRFLHYGSGEAVQSLLLGFTNKCMIALERIADDALKIKHHDEVLATYATVLTLGPSTPTSLLMKWAGAMLLRSSTSEMLDVATKVYLMLRSGSGGLISSLDLVQASKVYGLPRDM